MMIICGLVGPKPMETSGGDGQQVNIPALHRELIGRTKGSMPGGLLDFRPLHEECPAGKSAGGGNPNSKYRGEVRSDPE